MHSPRYLFVVLALLLLAPLSAQEKLVPPERLEGTALRLPVGTLELLDPDWSWYEDEEEYTYVSYSSDPDDEAILVVVYLPLTSSGNLADVKAMVESQLLSQGTPEEKLTLEVRESEVPAFGKTFLFQYRDADGEAAGYLATAYGHTLMLLVGGTDSAVAKRDLALKAFHPNAAALQAKPAPGRGFLDRTSAVPASRLEGLTLRTAGGRLRAPGPGWGWRQVRAGGMTVYICHESTNRFIAVVNSLKSEDLTSFVEGIVKGMTRAAGPALKIELEESPSELPFAGSKRVDLVCRTGKEVVLRGVSLLGTDGEQTLAIVGIALEPLSEEVIGMAQSFEKDPEAKPEDGEEALSGSDFVAPWARSAKRVPPSYRLSHKD